MKKSDIKELYYFTDIRNLGSILERGILSHNNVSPITPFRIDNKEVQSKRRKKCVPNGRPLHDYVNLYLSPKNPMLSVLRTMHKDLCILRVDCKVLNTPKAVITTGNAAGDYTRFCEVREEMPELDKDLIFAPYWDDSDPIKKSRKKSAKCAEVLIPDKINSSYILGICVSNKLTLKKINEAFPECQVNVTTNIFFYDKSFNR